MNGQLWSHYFNAGALAECAEWGRSRQDYGRHFRDAYGFNGDGVQAHTDGVITEYAFKLQADLRWGTDLRWVPGGSDFRKLPADVGDHYQVRSTRRRPSSWNGILVHPPPARIGEKGDKPFQVYIYACLYELPTVHLVGWVHGISAQQKKWWNTRLPRPCFCYPQRFLAPMNGIPVPDDFL